jgi:hypothetical protein
MGALAEVHAKSGGAKLVVGPTVGVLNSNAGPGVTADFLFTGGRDLPFAVGLETGLFYWQNSAAFGGFSGATSLVSIPVLPMILYPFSLPSWVAKPYVGAAMGVSITPVSVSFSSGGYSASGSTTHIYFEGLIKIGLKVSSFFIEPRFGLLKDQFVFLPTVGYSIDL